MPLKDGVPNFDNLPPLVKEPKYGMIICEAELEGGKRVCHRCHFTWDAKDGNPPKCR